jgi:hypothetical protein
MDAFVHPHRARWASADGDWYQATAAWRQGLVLARQLGHASYMAVGIAGIAHVLAHAGCPDVATRLLAAVDDAWRDEQMHDYTRRLFAATARRGPRGRRSHWSKRSPWRWRRSTTRAWRTSAPPRRGRPAPHSPLPLHARSAWPRLRTHLRSVHIRGSETAQRLSQ